MERNRETPVVTVTEGVASDPDNGITGELFETTRSALAPEERWALRQIGILPDTRRGEGEH